MKKQQPLSLSQKFAQKWTSENHKIYNPEKKDLNFLEFENSDDNEFFHQVIDKYIVKESPLEAISEDDKVKLYLFFLIQIATCIAPNDNHEFLMRLLKPLSHNSIFRFALNRIVDVKKLSVSKPLNLPFNGGYCLTNDETNYVFAYPHTPSEIFLISISSHPLEYDEDYLLESSYGSKNQGVILGASSFTDSAAKVKQVKMKNSKKMGDLCAQLKDPKRSVEVLGHLGKGLPGLNTNLLLKGLDFGLKFWPKK